jgi:recombination protein RecA
VDIENLNISQPDNGEQALEIAENLIRSGAIDIVIDSVALTQKVKLKEMGDSKMGLHRLMSQTLKKLTGSISKTNCTVFLYQPVERKKIGVMFGNQKQLE